MRRFGPPIYIYIYIYYCVCECVLLCAVCVCVFVFECVLLCDLLVKIASGEKLCNCAAEHVLSSRTLKHVHIRDIKRSSTQDTPGDSCHSALEYIIIN